MSGAAVIAAADVSKAFGRSVVLRDVTLRIGVGEAVAVFGPNGAGKSTMLRLFAGLMAPSGGRLRTFGVAGPDATVRRRIGLVAHQSFLYPDLTARENLLFYARMFDLPDAVERVRLWLDRVALAEAGARPVRLFSRGMEQRLALARALIHDPALVLLDEPWTGLDAASADWLAERLCELRDRGRTVVVATHDFERGLGVATRALIVHRGRVAWGGGLPTVATLEEAYRRITEAAAA